MTWLLVFILVQDGVPTATRLGEYQSMRNCFFARDSVLVDLEAYEGIPPVNTQVVCVRTDET